MAENNTNQSGTQNDTPLTFDEILEDKEYQSEFDKRVSKALETAKAKWQTSAETERASAVKQAEDALKATHSDEVNKLNAKIKKALIGAELVKAKARDTDVIMPLIDEEKVSITESGIEGLKEQIEALQTSKAYLFDTDNGTDKRKGKSGLDHGSDDGEDADDAKIRRIMGLPQKKG